VGQWGSGAVGQWGRENQWGSRAERISGAVGQWGSSKVTGAEWEA